MPAERQIDQFFDPRLDLEHLPQANQGCLVHSGHFVLAAQVAKLPVKIVNLPSRLRVIGATVAVVTGQRSQ
jgi:hypothetical protein